MNGLFFMEESALGKAKKPPAGKGPPPPEEAPPLPVSRRAACMGLSVLSTPAPIRPSLLYSGW